MKSDHFLDQRGNLRGVAVRIARYDRDVLTFNIAEVVQSGSECLIPGCGVGWSCEQDFADYRQVRILPTTIGEHSSERAEAKNNSDDQVAHLSRTLHG